MTQEDKELLLKDLCARLPYYVKAKDKDGTIITICAYHPCGIIDNYGIMHNVSNVKPYLFPLSSMTEEQHKEFYDKYCWSDGGDNFEMDSCSHYYALGKFNWSDKNHFDYRGLIPKGLALDATGLNIY